MRIRYLYTTQVACEFLPKTIHVDIYVCLPILVQYACYCWVIASTDSVSDGIQSVHNLLGTMFDRNSKSVVDAFIG